MPGLLGTQASIASDLNFLLQIIVFIVLLVGFKFGRTKTNEGLRRHGILMRSMIVLNLIGVVAVMIPTFIVGFDVVANELAKIGFPLIFVHAALGGIAVFLSIVPAFRKFGNVRAWMKFTFLVWFVTLLLGFLIYIGYYVLGFPT